MTVQIWLLVVTEEEQQTNVIYSASFSWCTVLLCIMSSVGLGSAISNTCVYNQRFIKICFHACASSNFLMDMCQDHLVCLEAETY